MTAVSTVDEIAVPEQDEDSDKGSSVVLSRLGINATEALILTVAAFSLVAYLPFFQFENWTPRVALMCLVVPIGLIQVAGASARRDSASILAVAVAAWAIFGATLTGSRAALIGSVGADLSTLLVCGYLAFWALGRGLSIPGRSLLVEVVVWGSSLSGLVGFAQIALQVDSGPFALYFGRAFGLMIHPVYFGALCSMGLVGIVARGGPMKPKLAFLYPTIATGCILSGSRAALGALALCILGLVLARRNRTTLLHSAAALGALLFGEIVGRVFSPSGSAISRVADSGFANRVDAWRYGVAATMDRPFTGWGFGRFSPAVQGRFDVDFVRSAALDDASQIWFDAHNVIVAIAVATGLIGLGLFLAWVLVSLKGAQGTLLWMCVPIALHWMVEPVSLAVAPIALLVLGASYVPANVAAGEEVSEPEDAIAPRYRRLGYAGAVLGVVAAAYLVTADLRFKRELDDFDAPGAASASRWYGNDPVVMDMVAQVFSLNDNEAESLKWRIRVTEAQPDRPYWWTRLAAAQVAQGELDQAFASVDTAYSLRPVSLNIAQTELLVAQQAHNRERLIHAAELGCALIDCDKSVAEIVEQALAGTNDPPP
jgi:O-antigen ligase